MLSIIKVFHAVGTSVLNNRLNLVLGVAVFVLKTINLYSRADRWLRVYLLSTWHTFYYHQAILNNNSTESVTNKLRGVHDLPSTRTPPSPRQPPPPCFFSFNFFCCFVFSRHEASQSSRVCAALWILSCWRGNKAEGKRKERVEWRVVTDRQSGATLKMYTLSCATIIQLVV